jgi:hypothetical protein
VTVAVVKVESNLQDGYQRILMGVTVVVVKSANVRKEID